MLSGDKAIRGKQKSAKSKRQKVDYGNSLVHYGNSLDEIKIEEQLQNPAYDFRTVDGLAKETGLEAYQIEQVLENSKFSRKSLARDKMGNALYTHRNRKIKLREYLSVIQSILAFPRNY